MEFVDFRSLRRSSKIDLLFSGWKKGEKVVFFSPHDDDAALGAGYLLLATAENKGFPYIFIFCSGNAGYSTPAEKGTIVSTRKKEAVAAYRELGVEKKNILFFDIPDFSLMASMNREEREEKSPFDRIVRFFRAQKISRVVFPSGHYEHWDHTAAFDHGIYTSPQAGDPILADLGTPHAVRSYLVYSVWGDFEPRSARNRQKEVRADLGILVDEKQETSVRKALGCFASQGKIMQNTMAILRERRRSEEGFLELYKEADVRKPIDFEPYFQLLKNCRNIS
jgi:LmbE family N-acetylglucosaminyl deacetylase